MSLDTHLCLWGQKPGSLWTAWGQQALRALTPEAVVQQGLWRVPASGRWDEKGKAGSRKEREEMPGGHRHLPTSIQVRSEETQGPHSLNDHGLQQAEAHHEVQWDGRLQVVPVQPQVTEVRHVLQIRGEVVEGHQVVGANLGAVDFYGERRGEVSRRGRQGSGQTGCTQRGGRRRGRQQDQGLWSSLWSWLTFWEGEPGMS